MRTRILALALVLTLCVSALVVLAVADGRERASLDAPLMVATELGRGAVHIVQEPVVLTPQREREIGLEFLRQVPVEAGNTPDAIYVREVFAAVVGRLGDYDYEVFIVGMQEPNAFALPGGFLVVTRGLLGLLKTEAELAFVIGHEINHVHRGHWRDGLKGRVALEKIGLGDLQGLARAAYSVLEAGFSESQELESDRAGVELAAAAGYAPRAAQLALRRFGEGERRAGPGHRDPVLLTADLVASAIRRYAGSHPPADQRIANAEQTIRDHRTDWERQRFTWGAKNFRQRTPKSKLAEDGALAGLDDARDP